MKVLLLFLCFLVSFVRGEVKSYDGYQVMRVWPENVQQLTYLNQKLLDGGVEFWNEPTVTGKPVDIMVDSLQASTLMEELGQMNAKNEVMVDNVEELIQKQKTPPAGEVISPKLKTGQNSFDFEGYYRKDDIYAYLDELEQTYPDIMTQKVIGNSYEGRDIRLVRLSKGGCKKAVWVDGGIHAREWIAPAVDLYLLTQVLEDGSLLDHHDFYFIPIVNPDGYEYSHTDDRMWRKNRRPGPDGHCNGVDLNRNFDNHFGGSGTSGSPCSEIYRGESAFSEPETQVYRDAVLARSDQIELLITLHSYSQFVMIPYGYAVPAEYPEDFDDLLHLAETSEEALEAVHGKSFSVANSADIYGAAAGATDDWAKQNAGIKYVYTVELRDTGRYGFLLPPDQIIPSGEEMWEFLKTACGILNAA